MPIKHEEITGLFIRETHRWDQTILAQVEITAGVARSEINRKSLDIARYVTVKGQAEECEFEEGMTYRFYGRWYEHQRHGRQFQFQTFTVATPAGHRGVVQYLQHCPGIGKAIAEAMWKEYGSEAVAKLREDHLEVARVIPRFSVESAEKAAKHLQEHQALEACSIDLVELLASRGFPKRLVKEATKVWGNRAAALIRRNPYLLMRFRGCGFLKCDALYLDLNLPPHRIKRQAYAAWHALASDTDGHTWHPVRMGVRAIGEKISSAAVNAPAALMLAKRAGIIDTYRDVDQSLWLADGKKARHEQSIAEHIYDSLEESHLARWPAIPSGTELSEHQLANVHLATSGGVIGILAGSPGTGKSFSAAVIIREIIRLLGEGDVAVCAPTGKAAVRVSEAMERYSIPLKATTIHRLLGVASADDGSGWSFCHGPGNPLPFKFIIVDESSMIDAGLMASLLAARGTGTHILFIGDPYQLPPVGHGAPLRDFIAAGLPCGELKEIRRNAGAIVHCCASIRDKNTFEPCSRLDIANGDNLITIETHGPERQIGQLEQLYASIKKAGTRDPVWDVQVLVPVNAKSQLGRKALNQHLQQLLNPAGESATGSPFRVGDKVICTKNGWLPLDDIEGPGASEANEDGKVFVANGEMGEVLEVAPKLTVVRLSMPDRVVKIPRGGEPKNGDQGGSSDSENTDSASTDTGCDWDLAYAISVHKSQGSEWPVAVVMIDDYPGARRVCSKNWIYTAISRAKDCCILIGKQATAIGYCQRDAIGMRKTFLKERIIEAMAELGQLNATQRQAAEQKNGQPPGEPSLNGQPLNGQSFEQALATL